MRLVHYSTTSGLTQTDPEKIGTSSVSNEMRRQGRPKLGATYFYREGTEPEDVVLSAAKHKYIASVPDDKVVDLSNDPKDTYHTALDAAGGSFWHHQDFHQALLDNDYHGYFNSNSGLPNAVAMLKPVKVKQVFDKKHKNTKFGDADYADLEAPEPEAKPTNESVVNSIVDRLLG